MIKMENLNIKKTIFEFILLSLVFFTLFVPNKYPREILVVILAIFAFFSFAFFKNAKSFSIDSKKVFVQMTAFACIFVAAYYFIGIYSGFYKNPIVSSVKLQVRYIITSAIIVILSEIIRYILVSRKEIISTILVTISLVVIDVILYAQLYDITVLEDFLALLGLVIFASLSENLLFNYVCTRYGYKPIMAYRLIAVLYALIIPVLPELYTYFKAVIRIVYPYLVFLFLENTYGVRKIIVGRLTKTKKVVSSIIVIFIGVMFALLISCKFYVGVIAIGSNSMRTSINKGDAVIYTKYSDQKLQVGEVILFNKGNISIVHRIIEIENVNNEMRYITKGDNNPVKDNGYATDEDIVGISRYRIKYVGYPSIWLGEFFNSIKK